MTTGKELVFIFLWTLTRCVAIQLNLWDQSSENWKDFDCASQRGTCLAVEVNSGNYRVMSAYIGKGTRLTIHTNIIEHRSESNTTNYEQACPTKWLATSGGWCQPPEEYKSDFGSFQLLPADRKKNVYLFFVDIPPGSSVLIKVIPTLEALLTKFKEASTTVSGKSDLMMSVSQSESEQYKSEEGLISWQKSMRGGLLHVSLANFDCPQWSRFFFAVRNLNKFTETINLFVEGKVSEAVESNGSRSVDIIARCN
ncbi:unnamed protein product [Bathycoccus prasinos]